MPELKPRHAELSEASGLFTDPAAAALRTNPLAQLWRENTTVLHAVRKITGLVTTDGSLSEEIELLKRMLLE
jgi:hypothetical protein